jgi:quercetin dioxygenase-like cupin family protein
VKGERSAIGTKKVHELHFFCVYACKYAIIFVPLQTRSTIKRRTMEIKSTELLRCTQAWDGSALPDYPSGRPELVVKRMVFPIGAKTEWHHHNVINYGIVEQGELTIVCEDGREHTFRQGEALVEVVGTVHRGENRGDKPVILNMFYVSAPGETITESEK